MKLSTKRGDKGMTSLLDGERVPKDDAYIEFLGTVDELQAFIGICPEWEAKLIIMNELYRLMAGENVSPWFNTEVEHPGKFMLLEDYFNLARVVCRRAERRAYTANALFAVPYLNRLSDYLYKMSVEFNQ